jgi:hypothetical protein
MVDQNLLTIFLALTAVAVLIQTGILVGFCLVSSKLSRQVDQAMDATRNLVGPLQSTASSLETVTARFVEFSASAQKQLRQIEQWLRRRAA